MRGLHARSTFVCQACKSVAVKRRGHSRPDGVHVCPCLFRASFWYMCQVSRVVEKPALVPHAFKWGVRLTPCVPGCQAGIALYMRTYMCQVG